MSIKETKAITPIAYTSHGYFGDPSGFEEQLYKTESGDFLLLGKGGPHSPYVDVCLTEMTEADAKTWVEQNADPALIEEHFAPKKTTRKTTAKTTAKAAPKKAAAKTTTKKATTTKSAATKTTKAAAKPKAKATPEKES